MTDTERDYFHEMVEMNIERERMIFYAVADIDNQISQLQRKRRELIAMKHENAEKRLKHILAKKGKEYETREEKIEKFNRAFPLKRIK